MRKLGAPAPERCFCLRLGGRYDEDNLGTISWRELVAFAGDVARQIEDVPDGGMVEFELLDGV